METTNQTETPELTVIEVKPTRIRNFLATHKTKLAVTATVIAGVVAHRAVVKTYEEFLQEHDLYDEFHRDPWDDELVAAETDQL